MKNCKYCKGTKKVLMLFSYVDCECVEKDKTTVNENAPLNDVKFVSEEDEARCEKLRNLGNPNKNRSTLVNRVIHADESDLINEYIKQLQEYYRNRNNIFDLHKELSKKLQATPAEVKKENHKLVGKIGDYEIWGD